MAIWKINDTELEFDVTDADTMERYEKAMNALPHDMPQKVIGVPYHKMIRAYCKAYRKLYDTIFGKNTSEKIFAGIPDSLQRYNAVYAKMLAFVAEQGKIVQDEMREIQETYAPESDNGDIKNF